MCSGGGTYREWPGAAWRCNLNLGGNMGPGDTELALDWHFIANTQNPVGET